MSCENHKKDVAGITDMKALAEAIGDLHYETLYDFLIELQCKFIRDAGKEERAGRKKLGDHLDDCAAGIGDAAFYAKEAWRLSKPFMEQSKQNKQ
jgi:hypothetical protein